MRLNQTGTVFASANASAASVTQSAPLNGIWQLGDEVLPSYVKMPSILTPSLDLSVNK